MEPTKNQIDLMEFVNKLADGQRWEHKYTQYLPDGRLIIQLKIEKKPKNDGQGI